MAATSCTAVSERVSLRKNPPGAAIGGRNRIEQSNHIHRQTDNAIRPVRGEGIGTLIFRNLHWSQALFAIVPDGFLRDSVRMAPGAVGSGLEFMGGKTYFA